MKSILIAVVLLACGVFAEAQQAKKVQRIGWLSLFGASSSTTRNLEAFRKALNALGYVEGKNVEILFRHGEGKLERLPELASELIRLQVSVIVTMGTAPTKAAKQATSDIPIVVGSAGDLVGEGLVVSLARPGGNITGFSAISPDLSGKRLEILKETVPKATRFAVLWHRNPNDEKEVKETQVAASAMRLRLQSLPIQSPEEFPKAYAAMRKERAGAVIFIQGPLLGMHREQLCELAAKNRLPSIGDAPIWTESGCLMSYGPDRTESYRRAAMYVDKILKGAKPADLPVQQPMKFDFVVNLKTANQLKLTIPQWTLMKADRVIR